MSAVSRPEERRVRRARGTEPERRGGPAVPEAEGAALEAGRARRSIGSMKDRGGASIVD